MAVCNRCGSDVPDGHILCPICGERMDTDSHNIDEQQEMHNPHESEKQTIQQNINIRYRMPKQTSVLLFFPCIILFTIAVVNLVLYFITDSDKYELYIGIGSAILCVIGFISVYCIMKYKRQGPVFYIGWLTAVIVFVIFLEMYVGLEIIDVLISLLLFGYSLIYNINFFHKSKNLFIN